MENRDVYVATENACGLVKMDVFSVEKGDVLRMRLSAMFSNHFELGLETTRHVEGDERAKANYQRTSYQDVNGSVDLSEQAKPSRETHHPVKMQTGNVRNQTNSCEPEKISWHHVQLHLQTSACDAVTLTCVVAAMAFCGVEETVSVGAVAMDSCVAVVGTVSVVVSVIYSSCVVAVIRCHDDVSPTTICPGLVATLTDRGLYPGVT